MKFRPDTYDDHSTGINHFFQFFIMFIGDLEASYKTCHHQGRTIVSINT